MLNLKNIELLRKYWGCNDDPYGDSGYYYIILSDGLKIWESSWYQSGYVEEWNECKNEVNNKLNELELYDLRIGDED